MVGVKGDSEEVTSVRPLREKTITGRVVQFTGVQGIVDGNIGFSLAVCESGYYPHVGDEVQVTCVECEHAHLSWRAVTMSSAPSEKLVYETLSFFRVFPLSSLLESHRLIRSPVPSPHQLKSQCRRETA